MPYSAKIYLKGKYLLIMGRSKTAVCQAITRYQQDDFFTDKTRMARPHVITAQEDNVMRIIVRSPTSSIKKIRAKLVRRGCRNDCFQAIIPRILSEVIQTGQKTKLTVAMKVKGLQFANNHQRWTAQQ